MGVLRDRCPSRKEPRLHLSRPAAFRPDPVLVLYASGDGGWFGAAVDMWRQIARAGYPTVGFSSRAFLRIDRSRGMKLNPAQLAAEYRVILDQARLGLGLGPKTRVILTGWSRGAAFALLAGGQQVFHSDLLGVVAIGLAEGEDLKINGAEDETDDGSAPKDGRRWPFDNYAHLARLAHPYAVIQATRDNYFPAAKARMRLGPDTPVHRLYSIESRNHRFSGGKGQFHNALLDALQWIAFIPGKELPGIHTSD